MASEPPARMSEWLLLMLAEINAKREAHERAHAEEERRRAEQDARADSRRSAHPG